MAKLIKIEGYLCDANDGFYSEESLRNYFDNVLDRSDLFAPTPFKIKMSKDFEWDDNIDLNYTSCTEEDCEKYFEGDE